MPPRTLLQIAARPSDPERIVELVGSVARVGGGVRCEVRITDSDLSDVECVLRRRGGSWTLQRIGSRTPLLLDGRVVEAEAPLAIGATFKLGGYRLTLQETGSGMGSYQEPIAVEPVEVVSVPFVDRARPSGGTAPERDPRPSPEEAGRRASDLDRRERWFRSLNEETRWEARWKSAADRLKARAAGETTRARRQESGPDPVAEPSSPPPPRRPSARAERSATERLDLRDHETHRDARLGSVSRVEPPSEEILSSSEELASLLDLEDREARRAWESSADRPPLAPEPRPIDLDIDPVESRPAGPPVERAPQGSPALDRPRPAPTESRGPGLASHESPSPVDRLIHEPGWLSVKEIIAAHQKVSTPGLLASKRSASRRPAVSALNQPDAVAIPARFAVPILLTLGLLTGTFGVWLAWGWGQDDLAAARAAAMLGQGGAIPPEGVELDPLPSASWWATTADHLLDRLALLGKVEGDPARRASAEYLAGLAAVAAPGSTRAAHARAALAEMGGAFLSIGESATGRDVVMLAAEARRCLRSGRPDLAIPLYREALVMACQTEPSSASPPRIDDAAVVRRAWLPNEDLIAPIVAEMASHDDWSFDDWRGALPASPLVLLATYRALEDRGDGDASRLLDEIGDLRGEGEPDGDQAAIDRAARAESLAFQGRWEAARTGYQHAIEAAHDASVLRVLCINLAEICDRAGDLEGAEAARLRARLSPDRNGGS